MSDVASSSATSNSSARFPIYWNVDEAAEPRLDVTKYGYTPRNATQVGQQCASDPPPHSNAGCGAWTQGLFPSIDKTGTWLHGGVPQNADLRAHLAALRATLPTWIPDPHWRGNAVLDFESWTTIWELNTHPGDWHSERYRNASRWLVATAHPSWGAAEVEAAAKRAFEDAATRWFVATLTTCRALRPNARWGFYGLPQAAMGDCVGSGDAMRCGFDGPHAAPLRAQAEVAQLPIWRASDAIYPSIYIPHSMAGKADEVRAHMRSTVGEAVRCAQLVHAAEDRGERASDTATTADDAMPVLPYGWDHFHAPPFPPRRLPTSFVVAQLQGSAEAGAAGVVFWGSNASAHNDSYWEWWRSDVAPAVKAWCLGREGGC